MKKILAILLAICTLLTLCGCSSSGNNGTKIEGNGYKSAEKAALAYAEALRSGDVRKILSTFAMETYVDSMDMEEYLYASGHYVYSMGLVSSDDYAKEIRLSQRQYDITRMLGYLYINYTEFGFTENMMPVSSRDMKPYDEFIEAMTVEDWDNILGKMKIGDVLTLGEVLPDEDMEEMDDRLKAIAKQYGCDNVVPLAVEVTLDGVEYYLCVNVANYDGTWYNFQLGGLIATLLRADPTSIGLVER